MENVTTPVLSGIAVLVAGLLAFIVLTNGHDEEVATVAQFQPAATYSNLDPVVERVLLGSGDAWIYEADVAVGIPQELARVLDAYRVPLLVPVGEGR